MKRNYSTIRVGKWMFAILAFSFFNVLGQSGVTGLKVEYREAPLGIDMDAPRFSWQMATNPMKRGQFQTAYQVIVSDEAEAVVWDSQKQESDSSSGVKYGGGVLTPGTKYNWQVKVWDETGSVTTASSWFETGLMDPDPRSDAWHGAQWIGGGDEELVLYSHYLSVFKMAYSLQLDEPSESTAASFVFGANDRRLMDKDKNIQGVGVQKDESYIRFELDITKVNGKEDGLAKFNVYRVGYTPDDSNAEPVRSYDIPSSLLNETNKYEKHTFHVSAVFGLFEVFLDGTSGEHKISDNDDDSPPPRGKIGFNLNPVGKGNDYISFPMIADIGFYAGAHQKAQFSEVQIRNYRAPSNVLFKEDMPVDTSYSGIYQSFNIEHPEFTVTKGGYQIGGGARGSFVVADPSRNAAPMLRTTFNTSEKKIKKARVYATARGIYELYLNGERVGDDYFNPGLTQYNKTQIYQTYDVTDQLKEHGKNALGAWLSEGWWSGNITYSGENWNYFGDRQSLLAQLVITYDDDSEQVITTNDTAWKLYTDGPIRYGSFFQGEVYDATREKAIDDWALPDYKDSGWKSPLVVSLEETAYLSDEFQYYDLKLIGQIGENPTIVRELVPQAVEEVRPGVFVYDMGQNMVGFPKVTLPAGMAGDTVTFRYAEVKYPDLSEYKQNTGMVMLENIRAALTQDLYFRNGGGSAETFQPRFTFHGYRFLEISGIEQPLPLENVKGMVVSSIRELASDYKTSNELVNKLWENITWSLRSNFLSIPTDTPARNERMGWSGDINVFSAASTYLADVGPFLSQHLLAMRDIQRKDGRFTDVAPVGGGFGGTLWGSAGIIVAWQVYQQYGDLALLQDHYDAMKKYVEFLNSRIDPETGVLNEGPLGDWLSPEGYKNDDTMLWAAYHLHDLEILARTARLLGKNEDAVAFEKQYRDRKQFFNNTYIDASTGKTLHLGNQSLRFGPPLPEGKRKKAGDYVDTQASYAIPLHLNVLNENNRSLVVKNLAESIKRQNEDDLGILRPAYSLMTGFIGTASLNHALSENGKDEIAYRLLQQTSYPSWLYSVKNGATTIWERLNSYTVENGFGGNNSMNSFNHYSFGAVASWMYNYSLGIQRSPEHPGFKHFILKPTPDPDKKMTWAIGYYDGIYGRIKSEWHWEADGWTYKTTIPANSTATLMLKAKSVKNITENDTRLKRAKGINILQEKDGEVELQLVSGSYEFKVKTE